MKKAILATMSSLAIMATAVGLASARTQPASLGTARRGVDTNLFHYSYTSGGVTATGIADWELGLVTDTFGVKFVNVTASATNVGAFVQVVTNDGFNTNYGGSGFSAIPAAVGIVNLNFLVNVPNNGIAFVDAMMNPGATIIGAQFTP